MYKGKDSLCAGSGV